MILNGVSVVYSQDIDRGIGAIPEAQTWYTCSKSLTNFISYKMKVVETPQSATPGFGTVGIGNHPKQFDVEGLLTFVANYTQIRYLIDPDKPQVLYVPNISCATEPVQECGGKITFPVQEIQCLGIVNPNQHETKFTASISFDANVPEPILIIPPLIDDTTPSPSAPSPTSTTDPNDSFPFNVANRLVIIDFEYLIIISLSFSILISIFSM